MSKAKSMTKVKQTFQQLARLTLSFLVRKTGILLPISEGYAGARCSGSQSMFLSGRFRTVANAFSLYQTTAYRALYKLIPFGSGRVKMNGLQSQTGLNPRSNSK